MRRYYVSPLEQVPGVAGQAEWRPVVVQAFLGKPQTVTRIELPDDRESVGAWGLVVVESPDHTPGLGDARNDALPDLTLDSTLGVLSAAQRNQLINRMGARGVNTSGWNTQTTFREVVRAAGRMLRADFDENSFDAVL